MSNAQKIAIVTGDVTMDWNLARTLRARDGAAGWTRDDCTRACWQRGGAAMLADLIETVAADLSQTGKDAWEIRQPTSPDDPAQVHPGDPRFYHSYAMWSLFKYGEKPDKEKLVWRVAEFLGLDRCADVSPSGDANWKQVVNDSPEAALVVLDDAALGFRDQRDLWPQAIRDPEKHRPWVVLKMARPVAEGELWDYVHRNFADRLIVVIAINDLRRTAVQISRELSWERTAQDIAWELVHNPRVNALSDCAHVIVSFYTGGVVLLSQPEMASSKSRCTLFFDPKVIEGMWEQDRPGSMIGYTSCITASMARQIMLAPDQPDIQRGIQAGLVAMRKLHLDGYGDPEAKTPQLQLAFPRKIIAAELAKDNAPFAVAAVQDPVRFLIEWSREYQEPQEEGFWTILKDRYADNLDQIAQRIVLDGPEVALQEVPLGQFGGLLTVDRRETESFRSIRVLVSEYCHLGQQKRPLSIAVFGSPGSGKSFGITEIAKSLMPGQVEVLEFNLSQFGSPDDLIGALHQARDVGLSGKIPLVFWDEFDTSLAGKPLGWLRYFLAPMQDGKFQEGQITHPIGRAIFVFAGGTCVRLDLFGKQMNPDDFRAAKGPDFVSRLKGYVNILGPNRQDVADPYYIIRRAILLRSILQRNAALIFEKAKPNIDPGVLRALLQTREYKHGVRSMEAIVAMSLLAGTNAFERSGLPSEAQLELHVDGRDFLALVQQIELEGETLERLAQAAHQVYCEGLRARGKTTDALVPYDELPEFLQEQNRGNVRDIANKLAQIGYVMIPARSNQPPFNFPGADLEKLAEMEHNRWMKAKMGNGWRYAPETDKARKLHTALLPWRKMTDAEIAQLFLPSEFAVMGIGELPEEEKEKDRDLVHGIPRILARAGYAIVKLREESTEK